LQRNVWLHVGLTLDTRNWWPLWHTVAHKKWNWNKNDLLHRKFEDHDKQSITLPSTFLLCWFPFSPFTNDIQMETLYAPFLVNVTFNNISVISWRSVLLVKETEHPERKTPTCRNSMTNFITHCYIEYMSPWTGFEFTTLVAIGTDCTGSCKSNYITITTTTALQHLLPLKYTLEMVYKNVDCKYVRN
jgi:hypothetical protein